MGLLSDMALSNECVKLVIMTILAQRDAGSVMKSTTRESHEMQFKDDV